MKISGNSRSGPAASQAIAGRIKEHLGGNVHDPAAGDREAEQEKLDLPAHVFLRATQRLFEVSEHDYGDD